MNARKVYEQPCCPANVDDLKGRTMSIFLNRVFFASYYELRKLYSYSLNVGKLPLKLASLRPKLAMPFICKILHIQGEKVQLSGQPSKARYIQNYVVQKGDINVWLAQYGLNPLQRCDRRKIENSWVAGCARCHCWDAGVNGNRTGRVVEPRVLSHMCRYDTVYDCMTTFRHLPGKMVGAQHKSTIHCCCFQ